ncbi:N-acetyltransferase [Pediococcus pentosaceus]|uniref:GNAT family N-acetyltransferase n=1 Tax=Pediococcus pentosaceus TaxID=1255 RepID=UPI0018E17847|nr:GNAT family N-acetyltransferase [Pediococcus pentosaceus]MBF7103572.1 N-acetyltransferase [Pediococcus pentosaceus]QQC61580.1 N-acetyltransferase [Pediococcus pentosaceus]
MERNIEANRLFWTNSEGVQVGHVLYSKILDLDTLICEEVFVNPEVRGQGWGGKLMKDFINFAIGNNQKIYPLCPFARKYFLNHPELSEWNMHDQITATKIQSLVSRKED